MESHCIEEYRCNGEGLKEGKQVSERSPKCIFFAWNYYGVQKVKNTLEIV